MFDSSAKIFSITGYEDDEFKRKIDLFELQVAPEKFDINFGKEYEAPGKNANGDKLVKGTPERKYENGAFRLS